MTSLLKLLTSSFYIFSQAYLIFKHLPYLALLFPTCLPQMPYAVNRLLKGLFLLSIVIKVHFQLPDHYRSDIIHLTAFLD